MHFTSGHFTVQLHFPVSGDKCSQSCLAQLSSYNKAAARKRWLLRRATLALPLSAHRGAGLQQVSECGADAVPNTCGSHLSQYYST